MNLIDRQAGLWHLVTATIKCYKPVFVCNKTHKLTKSPIYKDRAFLSNFY